MLVQYNVQKSLERSALRMKSPAWCASSVALSILAFDWPVIARRPRVPILHICLPCDVMGWLVVLLSQLCYAEVVFAVPAFLCDVLPFPIF